MNHQHKAFKDLVKQKLKEKGVSLEQASLLMGKAHNYLNEAFRTANPTVKTILLIEDRLGINLIAWNEQKPSFDLETEEVKKQLYKIHKGRKVKKVTT